MRTKKSQQAYSVVLVYPSQMTRTVKVKASTREVAESRALKRNPVALHVQRNA